MPIQVVNDKGRYRQLAYGHRSGFPQPPPACRFCGMLSTIEAVWAQEFRSSGFLTLTSFILSFIIPPHGRPQDKCNCDRSLRTWPCSLGDVYQMVEHRLCRPTKVAERKGAWAPVEIRAYIRFGKRLRTSGESERFHLSDYRLLASHNFQVARRPLTDLR